MGSIKSLIRVILITGKGTNMDNLRFRRQFLLSAKRCVELKSWKIEDLETHILYIHPDCESTRISIVSLDLVLIGYIIDPKFPEKSILDILNDISGFITINDVSKKLYNLVGRFVLLIKKENQYFFFNDACGLKLFFYTKYEENIYAASQTLLLKLVINLKEGDNYHKYYNSQYVKSNIEHWIPSGTSLYEDVQQLVPNHYLDVSKYMQIRYWPNKPIINVSFENSVEKFSELLKNTMTAANKKFKLALPLTAGWDTRIILSACKEISKDIIFYTLKYRNLTENSNDIKIPKKLLSSLGYRHLVLDCRKSMDEIFSDIYKKNTDIPHLNDWGSIANGMYAIYPSDRIAVKGNCAEICRCYYFPSGVHPNLSSCDYFLRLENNWDHIDFIKNKISEWFDEIKQREVNFGYDLLDLFYWEHRMGSWQAQSLLEWDIVQEAFVPFNNRELLDIMLGIETKYRCKPNYSHFMKAIQILWEETLIEPINPLSLVKKIKDKIKTTLIQIGIFYQIKHTVTNTKQLILRR